MGGFFGTANAAESAGTIAGGSSPAPILTPPPSPPPPVQMAMNAPTIAGGGSQPAGNSAQAFDARFKGSPLEGKWDVIKSSAESRGVPPALAAAIMAHESGNGKYVSGNNPGGLMDPATKMQSKQQFQSIDKGIDATVATIAKNYSAAGGDMKELANRYSPVGAKNDKGTNKDWLPGVSKIMGSLGGI